MPLWVVGRTLSCKWLLRLLVKSPEKTAIAALCSLQVRGISAIWLRDFWSALASHGGVPLLPVICSQIEYEKFGAGANEHVACDMQSAKSWLEKRFASHTANYQMQSSCRPMAFLSIWVIIVTLTIVFESVRKTCTMPERCALQCAIALYLTPITKYFPTHTAHARNWTAIEEFLHGMTFCKCATRIAQTSHGAADNRHCCA